MTRQLQEVFEIGDRATVSSEQSHAGHAHDRAARRCRCGVGAFAGSRGRALCGLLFGLRGKSGLHAAGQTRVGLIAHLGIGTAALRSVNLPLVSLR